MEQHLQFQNFMQLRIAIMVFVFSVEFSDLSRICIRAQNDIILSSGIQTCYLLRTHPLCLFTFLQFTLCYIALHRTKSILITTIKWKTKLFIQHLYSLLKNNRMTNYFHRDNRRFFGDILFLFVKCFHIYSYIYIYILHDAPIASSYESILP